LRRRGLVSALVTAPVALAVVGAAFASPAAAPAGAPRPEVRGMTVSTPTAGQEWGSETMVRTLEILRDLGVNWVAIHPYGGVRADGTVGRSRIDVLYDDPTWLTGAIASAHRLGLKILIKPHLAYWGTRFSWRGEIAFDDDASWERFFTTYEDWISKVARLSREADAFVVGTELDRTVSREEEWRHVIAAVRRETDVPLTYCAGWDRYRDVPFWDALDVVGIQAYFPVVDHEGDPAPEEIREGWSRIVAELEEFSRRQGRRIVFGELGYNRSMDAAYRPWAYQQDRDPRALELQRQCLDTALHALGGSDAIVGAFLWKWFPGEYPHGNFLLSTPEMREVIARNWRD